MVPQYYKNSAAYRWNEYDDTPFRIRRTNYVMGANMFVALFAIGIITLFFFAQRYYGQTEPQLMLESFFISHPPFSLSSGKLLTIDETYQDFFISHPPFNLDNGSVHDVEFKLEESSENYLSEDKNTGL